MGLDREHGNCSWSCCLRISVGVLCAAKPASLSKVVVCTSGGRSHPVGFHPVVRSRPHVSIWPEIRAAAVCNCRAFVRSSELEPAWCDRSSWFLMTIRAFACGLMFLHGAVSLKDRLLGANEGTLRKFIAIGPFRLQEPVLASIERPILF